MRSRSYIDCVNRRTKYMRLNTQFKPFSPIMLAVNWT